MSCLFDIHFKILYSINMPITSQTGWSKNKFSCEYVKHRGLFLYYYLLITALFSIQTTVNYFCPSLYSPFLFSWREHLNCTLSKLQLHSTVLSSIITMFYFRFLDLTHLTAETLDPCTSLPLFPQILLLVPGIHHSTGLPWEIFVQLPHISESANGRFTFTRLNNIPVCMYVPHIFTHPQTLRLLPYLGYCA